MANFEDLTWEYVPKETKDKIPEGFNLTSDQYQALLYMVQSKNVFITGPGGVGKSSVINLFKKLYQDQNLNLLLNLFLNLNFYLVYPIVEHQ